MIGYIFTDFLEMVEANYGLKVLNALVSKSNLESNGIYTSFGWYDESELSILIETLGKEIFSSKNDVKRKFGEYLFDKSLERMKDEIGALQNSIQLVELFEKQMVEKTSRFYPSYKPSKIIKNRITQESIEVFYESDGQLCHILDGFIVKSTQYFNEKFTVDTSGIYYFDKKSIVYSFQKLAA
jgi:hypothetical protein